MMTQVEAEVAENNIRMVFHLTSATAVDAAVMVLDRIYEEESICLMLEKDFLGLIGWEMEEIMDLVGDMVGTIRLVEQYRPFGKHYHKDKRFMVEVNLTPKGA